MRKLLRNEKGFTLLEILIVIIIIGVLAGLAIPAYQAAVEKSRAQEALTSLAATRQSLIRYGATTNSDFTNATFTVNQAGTLDYNPNTVSGGQTLIFSYALSGLAQNTFTITATRVGGGAAAGSTIALNQAGTITRTGVYQ